MIVTLRNIFIAGAATGLAACSSAPVGVPENGNIIGQATHENLALETGQRPYAIALSKKFSREVPDTVNFAFNKSNLDSGARAILRKQASWIKQFPEVRFRVFGYTDLVGTERYNKGLGMRRAKTVVAYLESQGVSPKRLQAVVSYGETRPLIPTQAPERRNRRAVTSVSGFVQSAPMVLNGKYAEMVFRTYVQTGTAAAGDSSGGSSGGQSTTMPSSGN